MKVKDIILDFTPLIDIALILLFFFLLFSHMEVSDAKASADLQVQQAQQQMADAQEQMEAAQEKLEYAEGLTGRLEEELEMVENADDRQFSNLQAMLDFHRGANIKLLLSDQDGTLTLTVLQGENRVTAATGSDDLAAAITGALTAAGYARQDTVFCEFILDGSLPGTASAYRQVSTALQRIKADYPYLYYSETDISMGKE